MNDTRGDYMNNRRKKRNKRIMIGVFVVVILVSVIGFFVGSKQSRLEKTLSYSISMTTRKPRPTETDGVDYFFVDEKTFVDKIAQGGLLEWARFVGNYYGTPKDNVDRSLDEGKNVVLEIEVQGALQVMKKCPDALTIFLVPPSLEELERRIRGRRTESEDIVKERLDKARKEIQTKDEYKYVVENDDVHLAKDKIAKIIKEHQK